MLEKSSSAVQVNSPFPSFGGHKPFSQAVQEELGSLYFSLLQWLRSQFSKVFVRRSPQNLVESSLFEAKAMMCNPIVTGQLTPVK